MHIGILGHGQVSKSLIEIIDKKNHKIFVWHRHHPVPRDEDVKKYWGDSSPHEMVQRNMIDIVVDALGSDSDEALQKSKWAIETALKNEKYVITCNKRLMDLYGDELCKYAKQYNRFYINPLVAHSSEHERLNTYLEINNFNSFNKNDLFKYRGAGPKETAYFIYEEIKKIGEIR